MTIWITICDTCGRDDRVTGAVPTHGEAVAAMVEVEAEGAPVSAHRASGLMGREAAGIVACAALHADSGIGQVPQRSRPGAVEGHFVTRSFPQHTA